MRRREGTHFLHGQLPGKGKGEGVTPPFLNFLVSGIPDRAGKRPVLHAVDHLAHPELGLRIQAAYRRIRIPPEELMLLDEALQKEPDFIFPKFPVEFEFDARLDGLRLGAYKEQCAARTAPGPNVSDLTVVVDLIEYLPEDLALVLAAVAELMIVDLITLEIRVRYSVFFHQLGKLFPSRILLAANAAFREGGDLSEQLNIFL